MNFLFSKRGKSVIKWVWAAFAVLIILSMIFAYGGGMEVLQVAL